LAGHCSAVPPLPGAAMEDWRKGTLIKLGSWGCDSALLLGVGFVGVSRGGILLLATLLAVVLVCQVSVGTPVSSAGMGQCNGIK